MSFGTTKRVATGNSPPTEPRPVDGASKKSPGCRPAPPLRRHGRLRSPLMVMSPRLRKLALMAHVTSSVGWLGAVASFLVLAVAGLSSGNAQIVRGAYVVMSVIAWWIIVPACFASL